MSWGTHCTNRAELWCPSLSCRLGSTVVWMYLQQATSQALETFTDPKHQHTAMSLLHAAHEEMPPTAR